MPKRPDWLQMEPSAWYSTGKQAALFDEPGSDPDADEYGTTPFEGCTVEELRAATGSSSKP
ncbi:hypothetical protein [Kitasatospora cheerisanensis]|uniref:Uncharacterized protein n=1 Tax=Kitasatospora cheerisanensis KCTC 2395 TaxID=1348663 RepID=A0A066YWM0_9ACTN|nr:hypothetical protein [Kitasatospora cheerisanensis]KDN85622.1 hypothetical protein KCH_26390 [Kitasatospora cheerisanensis KCTC 2395]